MGKQQDINYQKWLEFTIDAFHDALDKYNIGKLDGNLWRSIMGQVVGSGENVERIIIKFLYYGRFVDMGAGRGVSASNRAKKPWYSKTKTREIARLRELMASSLSEKAISEVEQGLKGDITIKLITIKL